jgi:hypothetical protein
MSTLVSPKTAPATSSLSKKLMRGVAACALLAVCAGILALAMTSENAANRDFISYWAAGQRLVHHADPYDASAIFAIEKSAGWSASRPLIMRNPPFALFLTVPLGFVGMKAGAVLWSMLILLCLMASIRLLRGIAGNPDDRLHLIGYFFAPSLACLLAGQTSAFALLGLTLFLYFHRTRPLVAGAALLLCALKPHLFLPFGVVLLAWVVANKAYRVVYGAALALGIFSAVPLLFCPPIYSHYLAMARTAGIEAEFVPTLGELLRIIVKPEAAWLQFVPAIAGCVWAFWYFHHRRNQWDWSTHGSLLMILSLLVAPYSWFTDQVVLLPAIFYAIYLAAASPRDRSLLWFFAINGVALIEVLYGIQLDSALYLWTPVAWFAWYLLSRRYGPSLAQLPEAAGSL